MDPFQGAPPEIRLKILGNIMSVKDLQAVASASPTMFQQLKADRMSLYRNIILCTLDEELCEIALATVLFPPPDLKPVELDRLIRRSYLDRCGIERRDNELDAQNLPSAFKDDEITKSLAEICASAREFADFLLLQWNPKDIDARLKKNSMRIVLQRTFYDKLYMLDG